mmetsp:Transcript_56715/g.165975  ORF Transcript_56715/g.165975 Transcript_56715/m.165975 type:complete len:170 (-) Transcript_56715:120-629(-)
MAAMNAAPASSRRCRSALLSALAGLCILAGSSAWSFAAPGRLAGPAAGEALQPRAAWGGAGALGAARPGQSRTARHVFGLGTSEILVILAVGAIFFGPETLKGFAKEAGKAASDLKDVPKAFEEGMDVAAAEKGQDAGETKVLEAKDEKEAKKDEKEAKKEEAKEEAKK